MRVDRYNAVAIRTLRRSIDGKRRAAVRAGVQRKIMFFVAHLAGYTPLGVFACIRDLCGVLLCLARLDLIILPVCSVKFLKRAVPQLIIALPMVRRAAHRAVNYIILRE